MLKETSSLLSQIEERNGIIIPEETKNLFAILDDFETPYWFLLNMRKTSGHWFSEYDFFIIRPYLLNVPENGKFFCGLALRKNSEPILITANNVMQDVVKRHWLAPENSCKVFVFAWSHQSVEKDIGLFYLFDENNVCKGIFVDSLNFTKGKGVFIANNLSELFNIERAEIEEAIKSSVNKEVYLSRQKQPINDFRKILSESQYRIIDSEFGVLMNYAAIKEFIDNTILPFTSKALYYDTLKDISVNSSLTKIEWKIEDKEWAFEHPSNTDYFSPEFINNFNKILEYLGKTDKRFLLFTEPSFGHEFGMSFVSPTEIEKLKKVKNLRFL